MSTTDIHERPAFQSLELDSQPYQPPLSRLAVAALLIGVLSLFAAFSIVLLPLSMLAIALGLAVVWKLSHDDQVTGLWLAQIGLGLSAASVVWSVTAQTGKEAYFYRQAGQHAEVFMHTLANGNLYDALELRQPENARQLTGTDLEKYYASQAEEAAEETKAFIDASIVKQVQASGPNADWRYTRGVSVSYHNRDVYVTVELVNQAANSGKISIHATMLRQTGLVADADSKQQTALWSVSNLREP